MRLVSRGPLHPRQFRAIARGIVGARIRTAAAQPFSGVATLAAMLCAALSLSVLPAVASAQESTQIPIQESASSNSTDAGPVALADTTPAAAATPETAAPDHENDDSAQVLNTRTHVVSMNDMTLDDQMLARQRGGAVGFTMVAATPQMLQGNSASVTLWDEIAPPAPLPVPVDSERAAQSNVASYLRR